ncbi:MAG: DEAD/DEAH box helicase [Planctomycetaceae bacterium]|jgi:non-specific serine/threonine protein kinase|nr:DEAD/DEAH box helicase [Planctomycetaceae bacterium]
MSLSKFPVVFISPLGHPYLVFSDGEDSVEGELPSAGLLSSTVVDRIVAVFSEQLSDKTPAFIRGILHLATVELETLLPDDLSFLRSFGQLYLTRFCHLTELGNAGVGAIHLLPEVVPLSSGEFEFFLLNLPPVAGAEYLSIEVLLEWWRLIDGYVHDQIASYSGGAVEWITKQNPLWRTVGRVTFHLAENKKDDARPFAFMATYTDKAANSAKTVQLPLSKALTEYASLKDKKSMLRLLQPINNAAEKCDWVQAMVDDQSIYQPRAWTPKQAHQFLQDVPLLESSGLIVRVPDWWKSRRNSRPQIRVDINTKDKTQKLGVGSLLSFNISTVLNDELLTESELLELMNSEGSLVRLRGQWVEVDREKLGAALAHWDSVRRLVREEGLSFYEGMRLLSGLPVDGNLDSLNKESQFREWSDVVPVGEFAEMLTAVRDPANSNIIRFDKIGLNATLRPYQEVGVRWLSLMSQLGLGACLADDMGLGKTIQVIALLLYFKHQADLAGVDGGQIDGVVKKVIKKTGATNNQTNNALLVVPASLLGNWESEVKKFASGLSFFVAHSSGGGVSEPVDVGGIDLVVTTYGMVERLDWIQSGRWRLVILDEAQAIKNAGSRQSRAVKRLQSSSRIILTGTPVENRLSDLWSLFDFLNPGLLGTAASFSRFVKSLSKERERANYAPLRRLTQPYILRRLKTDKSIISDLPDKVEVTAWCGLSKRQAMLYSQTVAKLKEELDAVGESDRGGIGRRGLVLSYLMQFKQICNHPSQWLGDGGFDLSESGKFDRLRVICEEIASRQEKVLVFTQFREITVPLAELLQKVFRRSGLILDGGTPIKKRREMVEAFQMESGSPFFILSLRAGGTGLNLTAASQVVHFDRWWNPAVENQATDRAFRIGQKKNVLVHKFVCRGTIEERIDEMIESKKSLAKDVIKDSSNDNGESLITEMTNEQILQMVSLDINKTQDT